ncbi:MAG: DUF2095 family protein, partial [Candidatus Hermodarchaeia archaeon]
KSKPKKTTDIASNIEKDETDAESEDLADKILGRLPHLANEMQSSKADVRIEGVRWEDTDRTRQPMRTDEDRFSGYSPDIIDFLRRCNTEDEALEIIDFLEKRREINPNHAKELRNQLKTQGLQSFGTKKIWGHYERETR